MEDFLRLIKNPFIVALLLATGTFSGIILDLLNPPRHDPFYGQEGKALERRIEDIEFSLKHGTFQPAQEVQRRLIRIEDDVAFCQQLLLENRAGQK